VSAARPTCIDAPLIGDVFVNGAVTEPSRAFPAGPPKKRQAILATLWYFHAARPQFLSDEHRI
jgi:hypothetical protein